MTCFCFEPSSAAATKLESSSECESATTDTPSFDFRVSLNITDRKREDCSTRLSSQRTHGGTRAACPPGVAGATGIGPRCARRVLAKSACCPAVLRGASRGRLPVPEGPPGAGNDSPARVKTSLSLSRRLSAGCRCAKDTPATTLAPWLSRSAKVKDLKCTGDVESALPEQRRLDNGVFQSAAELAELLQACYERLGAVARQEKLPIFEDCMTPASGLCQSFWSCRRSGHVRVAQPGCRSGRL